MQTLNIEFFAGDFSVLQVSFNMQRLSGYFLIQVCVFLIYSRPQYVIPNDIDINIISLRCTFRVY